MEHTKALYNKNAPTHFFPTRVHCCVINAISVSVVIMEKSHLLKSVENWTKIFCIHVLTFNIGDKINCIYTTVYHYYRKMVRITDFSLWKRIYPLGSEKKISAIMKYFL